MGDGDGGGVDYGGSMDDGGSMDNGSSVDEGCGVVRRRVVCGSIVRGTVVADDALGGDSRAVVQRQESSTGGGQHGAEGEHLGKQYILSI